MQAQQTWNQFLTVGVGLNEKNPSIFEWNGECSYRNISPATAIKRHKEMYPNQSIKVIAM